MRACQTTLEAEMTSEEQAFLLSHLGPGKLQGKHLEVGTAAGGTLWRMMQCYEDGHRPPFVVVDPLRYFSDQHATVCRNLTSHGLDPSQVEFRVKTSKEALAEAAQRNDRFDFILIDGNHKIMAVTADLNWTQFLNVGGIICFHDYTWQHKGVLLSVNRFLRKHRNFVKLGTAGTLLALRKENESTRPPVGSCGWIFAWMWYVPLQLERKWEKFKAWRQLKAAAKPGAGT